MLKVCELRCRIWVWFFDVKFLTSSLKSGRTTDTWNRRRVEFIVITWESLDQVVNFYCYFSKWFNKKKTMYVIFQRQEMNTWRQSWAKFHCFLISKTYCIEIHYLVKWYSSIMIMNTALNNLKIFFIVFLIQSYRARWTFSRFNSNKSNHLKTFWPEKIRKFGIFMCNWIFYILENFRKRSEVTRLKLILRWDRAKRYTKTSL